jgi:hypothetical protein
MAKLTVFISSVGADGAFAQRLRQAIVDHGGAIVAAPPSPAPPSTPAPETGAPAPEPPTVPPVAGTALQTAQAFVAVLSPTAIQDGRVQAEAQRYDSEPASNRKHLTVPVLLEPIPDDNLPVALQGVTPVTGPYGTPALQDVLIRETLRRLGLLSNRNWLLLAALLALLLLACCGAMVGAPASPLHSLIAGNPTRVPLVVPTPTPMVTPTPTPKAPNIDIYVGYADNARPSPGAFPSPWEGDAGVIYEGCSPSSRCRLDGGAVRVVNTSGGAVTIDAVVVHFDGCLYDLWPHGISLPAGGQLIVTQTASGAGNGCTTGSHTGPQTMDSSDIGPAGAPWAGNCNPSGLIPEVDVSVNGTTTAYSDAGQVLNTGGVDQADCNSSRGPAGNESAQWQLIGQTTV